MIRFARVPSHITAFTTRNKSLTDRLLQQGYRYHKLRKAFSKFFRRYNNLVSKFKIGLHQLLLQGVSQPEFFGDIIYKFRKIKSKPNFSERFQKIINRYKIMGYNVSAIKQSACVVFDPITVKHYAFLFNCTPVGRGSDSMMAQT